MRIGEEPKIMKLIFIGSNSLLFFKILLDSIFLVNFLDFYKAPLLE